LSARLAVREKAAVGLHPDITRLANPDFIDLVSVLGLLSVSQEGSEAGREEDQALKQTETVVRGMQAVEDWPQALADLTARAIKDRRTRPELWTQIKRHARAYGNPAIRDLLVTTVPELRQSLKRVTMPNSPKVMLQTELVQRTGLKVGQAAKVCKALAKETHFVLAKETMIDHSLACEFIARLTESSLIGSTAHALRLPNYAIAQLVADGVLEAPASPGIAAVYPEGRVTKASQLLLLARLVRLPVLEKGSRSTLPLSVATKIIGGGPKPWAAIFGAILSRAIPCWRYEPNARPTVRNLGIQMTDLHKLQMLGKAELPNAILSGTVSKSDAHELLNVTTVQGKWFEKTKMLEFRPSGKKHVCSLEAVLELAAARIYGAELALLLRCTPNILS